MFRSRYIPVIAVGLTLCVSLAGTKASAQNASTSLKSLIVGSPTSDAILSGSQTDALIHILGTNISTFPTTSASAAFVTRTSSGQTTGEPNYLAHSFGTLLLDRSATTGGTLALSVFVDSRRWRHLDDLGLNRGDLSVALPDGTQSSADIDLRSNTLGFQVQYGLTSLIDLGVNVPLSRVCVEGSRHETVAGRASVLTSHGCSTGLGDVSVRVKANPIRHLTYGVAFGADALVPSGKQDELLGRGTGQVKLYATGAKQFSDVQINGELAGVLGGHGIQFSSTQVFGVQLTRITSVEPSSEWQAGVSVDWSPSSYPALTVFGESLQRVISNGVRYESFGSSTNNSIESHPVSRALEQEIAIGAKHLIKHQWVISGAVTDTPTTNGLTPGLGWLLQLERHARAQ